jgi:hypothetical protein
MCFEKTKISIILNELVNLYNIIINHLPNDLEDFLLKMILFYIYFQALEYMNFLTYTSWINLKIWYNF